MKRRHVATIANQLGLYSVRVWKVRPFLRRPYFIVDCDTCDRPDGERWWNSVTPQRYAQIHAGQHQDQINATLGLPWTKRTEENPHA